MTVLKAKLVMRLWYGSGISAPYRIRCDIYNNGEEYYSSHILVVQKGSTHFEKEIKTRGLNILYESYEYMRSFWGEDELSLNIISLNGRENN